MRGDRNGWGRVAGLVVGAAAVLGACGAPGLPRELDRAPQEVASPAPEVDLEGWGVPASWDRARVVDPGWDQPPLELDGYFLGFAMPQGDEGVLQYTATDSQGEILWRAGRPASCTGFALTRADGRPVAVLTDVGSSGSSPAATATAYDLATGRRLWGPVGLPGPHQGPGLVFAEAAPAMGETGARVALDAATGGVVAREGDEAGLAVVGEYDGVVVTSQGDVVTAVHAADEALLWTIGVEALGLEVGGTPRALPGRAAPTGAALIGPGERGDDAGTGALVDLASGTVVARDVREAVRDAAAGTWVVLGPMALAAYEEGGRMWTRPVVEGAELEAAGGALVYLRVGDALAVRNSVTGAEAVAYETPAPSGYAVPSTISVTGAAAARLDRYVLLTVPG